MPERISKTGMVGALPWGKRCAMWVASSSATMPMAQLQDHHDILDEVDMDGAGVFGRECDCLTKAVTPQYCKPATHFFAVGSSSQFA
jgi:hypothetical protein